MGKVIQFPKSDRQELLDKFCDAMAQGSGPRELLEVAAHPAAVSLRVADVELWFNDIELQEFIEDLHEALKDARDQAGGVGR